MKTKTKLLHYQSLDCNPKYIPQIQNILYELGFSISRIYRHDSYFLGFSFRIHFSRPVPEYIIEAALADQSIVFFFHLN